MRLIETLNTTQRKETLYAIAYYGWQKVENEVAEEQLEETLAIGEPYEVIEEDFEEIGITVFPTSGPPQRP